MFRIAYFLATAALSIGVAATRAEAGERGLATGLFFGAVGAQIIDQSYQAQRRQAYEAEQIRKERAIAARRAAAAQQARAAEYRRIQFEKAKAAKIAAENEQTAAAKLQEAPQAAAPKADMIKTSNAEKTTTSSSATASSADTAETADTPKCRKYSAAVGGMIDASCP